jgi:hypothetical protein
MDLPVALPEPVRESGHEPAIVQSQEGLIVRTALESVRSHLGDGLSVGLITSHDRIDEVAAALRYEGLQFGDGREVTNKSITLVDAAGSKGLEFDAVVIVEPAEIRQESGLGELFVAMTRTTTKLTLVHEHPLPSEMVLDGPATPVEESVEPEITGGPDGAPTEAEHAPVEEAGPSETATDVEHDLSDQLIDALVAQVGNAIEGVLSPNAVEEFLRRLAERLRSH